MTSKNKMSVLNTVFNAANIIDRPNLQNILFVCVQHLLYTSIDLFETLIHLGARPHNIFLLGKHYSTCDAVATKVHDMGIQLQKLTPLKKLGEYTTLFNQDVANMWQQVQQHIAQRAIEAVVVLDDGGRCLEFIKRDIIKELPVIGIEQTTAGLFNPAVINLHVPFIDVAACAAKSHLESDLIAEAILYKLNDTLPPEKKGLSCGVVGIGTIGKAVTKQLTLLGCKIYLYDQNKSNYHNIKEATYCDNLQELMQQADYIFGCTGRDISVNIMGGNVITRDKIFISCTSEDKEFLSLLQLIHSMTSHSEQFNPLKDVKWRLSNGATINIVKGGFPINFDDSGESVPADKIQLTRGLLLTALLQAITSLHGLIKAQVKGRIMLHPEAQKFVVQAWLKTNKNHQFAAKLLDNFENIDWITSNSGGLFCESEYMKKCFMNDEAQALIHEKAADSNE